MLVDPKDPTQPEKSNSASYFDLVRSEAEICYEQYLSCVDPVVHLLHVTSFKKFFSDFWDSQTAGSDIPPSHTALVSVVCYAGGASMHPMQTMSKFGVAKEPLLRRLETLAVDALLRANCRSSSNLRTLQAFTLYLVGLATQPIRFRCTSPANCARSCNVATRSLGSTPP
jgi:hypothetical protein